MTPGHDRDRHQVDERDDVDELRQRLQHVVDRAQRSAATVRLSAAHTPSRKPSDDASARRHEHLRERCPSPVPTRPITPIETSIASVVISAGRRPLTTNAIAVEPEQHHEPRRLDEEAVAAAGARTATMKLPIGFVMCEDERRRVLDVVEHRLDLREQPVLRRPARTRRRRRRTRSRGRPRAPTAAAAASVSRCSRRRLASVTWRCAGSVRFGHRLGRAVERDRHDHDRGAGEDRERRVRVEAARDRRRRGPGRRSARRSRPSRARTGSSG